MSIKPTERDEHGNVIFKAVVFKSGKKEYYYYNITLPKAIEKVKVGSKLILTDDGEFIEKLDNINFIDPIEDYKSVIIAYTY